MKVNVADVIEKIKQYICITKSETKNIGPFEALKNILRKILFIIKIPFFNKFYIFRIYKTIFSIIICCT